MGNSLLAKKKVGGGKSAVLWPKPNPDRHGLGHNREKVYGTGRFHWNDDLLSGHAHDEDLKQSTVGSMSDFSSPSSCGMQNMHCWWFCCYDPSAFL